MDEDLVYQNVWTLLQIYFSILQNQAKDYCDNDVLDEAPLGNVIFWIDDFSYNLLGKINTQAIFNLSLKAIDTNKGGRHLTGLNIWRPLLKHSFYSAPRQLGILSLWFYFHLWPSGSKTLNTLHIRFWFNK
jgi:hypothetical protein